MTALLFDTSLFICHLRGEDPQCSRYIRDAAEGTLVGFISSVTTGELFAGEKVGPNEEVALNALLDPFSVVPADSELAADAGRLVRKWRRSHGIGLMDAMIAATALNMECPILTLNVKHFYFIPGLVVINPVSIQPS